MPIIARASQGKWHLAPAGTFQAVCYNVWDLGHQKELRSEKVAIVPRIIIGWELSETITSGDEMDGKRYVVSKRYRLSLHEKSSLFKDLISWRNRSFTDAEKLSFDVEKVIGINCMLNIVHNVAGDKTFANVASIMSLPKGMMPMRPENGRTTPEWIQNIIDIAITPDEPASAVALEVIGQEEEVPF